MSTNPWTDHALAHDYHLGDAREAALIAAENGTEAPLTCPACGGAAHYRHTVGREQCTRCRALRLSYERAEDGAWFSVWSTPAGERLRVPYESAR